MTEGQLVMSHDPGDKMIRRFLKPHGPWLFERRTKGGMALIQHPETGEERSVPPSLIHAVGAPCVWCDGRTITGRTISKGNISEL